MALAGGGFSPGWGGGGLVGAGGVLLPWLGGDRFSWWQWEGLLEALAGLAAGLEVASDIGPKVAALAHG